MRFALALAVLGGGALASADDASAWINKGIRDAIAQGKSEYVIPAGNFSLSGSIVIPNGTRNFTLRGQGKGLTSFRGASAKIGYAIYAGIQSILFNNWGVANLKSLDVPNVSEGATTIALPDVSGIKAGDYLALWDMNWVKQCGVDDAQRNHAELVRVTSVDNVAKKVNLDRPVARNYDVLPKVSFVDPQVIANLTVRDMSFDASVDGTTDRNMGLVSVGVADKVNLTNLDVQHFNTRAVVLNWTRDVTVYGVTINDGSNPGAPGQAYGVTVCRSRDVAVRNCVSSNTRHGYIATNGSTDVTYTDCVADGGNGNFDTHGFDERRIAYIRCQATGTLNVGNEAYLAGGSDFTIQDSTFGMPIILCPNAKKIRAYNSSFGGVATYSKSGTNGYPSGGMSDDAVFTNCSFDFSRYMLQEYGDSGSMTFNNCTMLNAADTWTIMFQALCSTGKMTLQSCNLISRCTKTYIPVLSANPSRQFAFTMKDCKIYSAASAYCGINLQKGFMGTATLTGNTFYSNCKGGVAVLNEGGGSVSLANNQIKLLSDGATLLKNGGVGQKP